MEAPIEPSTVKLSIKRGDGVVVFIEGQINELRRLEKLKFSVNGKIFELPEISTLDIEEPDLMSITYYMSRKDETIVSRIHLKFASRFYSWGLSSSRVVYTFNDLDYHGRELIIPVGPTETKGRFEIFDEKKK